MMNCRPLLTGALVLAAMFTPGFLTAASADVVYMDDLSLTLNGTMVFSDTFSVGLTLAGGNPPGTVLPSGTNFSDGSSALYQVIGTVAESGNKAKLDTAQGAHLVQSAPGFHHFARANIATLLTGPPTGPFSTPFSLTPSVQLVAVVPEPSSLALLASSIPGVLGLARFRRRRADGHRSKIQTRT